MTPEYICRPSLPSIKGGSFFELISVFTFQYFFRCYPIRTYPIRITYWYLTWCYLIWHYQINRTSFLRVENRNWSLNRNRKFCKIYLSKQYTCVLTFIFSLLQKKVLTKLNLLQSMKTSFWLIRKSCFVQKSSHTNTNVVCKMSTCHEKFEVFNKIKLLI